MAGGSFGRGAAARHAVWLTLGLGLTGCVLPRPIARGDRGAAEAATGSPPPARAAWVAAAQSVEGRDLEVCDLGTGAYRVCWIGGIHGDEREGAFATEELARILGGDASWQRRAAISLVRDLNPDGSARQRRGNARGVDLNRNFPARNFRSGSQRDATPLDQPESRFAHDWIAARRPDLVIACHSTRRGPFINYDGPALALALAQRFAELSSYPVVSSDALHSTPGSLGSWLGRDLGIPVLTIEWQRGTDPTQAWAETRTAILAVLQPPE